MYNALLIALVVVSILLILIVIMQPSKSNAASTLTGGGADQPQGRQKARGFEAFLIRATSFLGIAFFVIAIALAYLSAQK
ncbi:preprotein translocase subunit SecG [Aerococcaceae bacterium zg-ZJ1578]|uniref:preprotein translocase subunit SecG n=1 Tax=Aerococcaceae TaxID=186827 RepID=UPI0013B8AD28|nr:preprotein translocase subunit SecG [Aerococcaceae bacterium zg-1578]MBR7928214.1 preprotein translocase subunit SecG [Aerococcaceae bacterium zg-ZUI334]MBS4462450.1 preprotein translocase subunit SecG [Aerococcaceae bacterium zg-B36]NEW65037.1 preprotein translocase subunit SecG [Facklamia sp. 252]NEW68618.1 preprotein translocase subunit SecG [Facklamia sp. 253]QQD65102.1 preprotein translocase subunit SecG [Aerococcaceae bacterium zg-252]